MFDAVTAPTHALARQQTLLWPAAAFLHLALIAGLVARSWWLDAEVPPPDLMEPFQPPVVKLDLPGGGGGPPEPPPQGSPTGGPKLLPILAPIVVRDLPQAGLALEPAEVGVPEIGQSGDDKGIPGGTGEPGRGGIEGLPPGPPGLDDVFKPGGEVIEPVLVHRVEPIYPDLARRLRLEGVVFLQAIIAKDGSVEEVRVVGSVHPLLDEAAVQAIGQWRYRPGTLRGTPVRVQLTVKVEFRLH